MIKRVLIVDDSAVFRKVLQTALDKHPGIRVVGTAANGKEALRLVRTLRPHVMILDVEMPEMNGLETLDELRRQHLDPGVIMFSSFTSQGAATTLETLAKGAFDFVTKPTGAGTFAKTVARIKEDLVPKIEAYSRSIRVAQTEKTVHTAAPTLSRGVTRQATNRTPGPVARSVTEAQKPARRIGFAPEVVAIGISTGGPNALNEVIPRFPKTFPLPILLVQHMPPVFTSQLADRLNKRSQLRVVEAKDEMPVEAGTVYVAPGDYHMEVEAGTDQRLIRTNQGPPVNSCRPSVDVLFHSVAEVYGQRAIAVVMTGMGQDGLGGSRELKKKGALVLAQDKDSSVVWGMPRFVVEEGLADRIMSLSDITPTVLELAEDWKKAGGNGG
jgi:two-component system chemotaxis response regulator CheB